MMHVSSKKRWQCSFAGSLLFHAFLIILLATTGLFALNKNDDRILEVAVFGGGGGGQQQGSQGALFEGKEKMYDSTSKQA
ncbi:MAG: hypothetical protein ACRC8T_06480, partial [Acidaminococcaceae bacterium]